jgi:formate hydrogenlyase transcriptional activator
MSDSPLIAVVDDDEAIRDAIQSLLRSAGFRAMVFASAQDFLQADQRQPIACLIVDICMTGMSGLELQRQLATAHSPVPIIFITAHGDVETRARALREGAVAFFDKPFNNEVLLQVGNRVRSAHHGDEIIGASPALKEVLRQVEVIAPTAATVLLQGETGTGKELLARTVHQQSFRSDHPFVTINCAAIPSGLLESELFGHERGAFTGAIAQKMGRFELAHGGTLFLDEIGDLPLELQPKLLRVLQEQTFERLGSTRTWGVDVRLVAATNRDLLRQVEAGQFRPDLYYRLNVFPITVPPLRQRPEDIPLLARHFVRHYAQRMRKRVDIIPAEVIEALTHHSWPGNIRQLQNVIERAVILSPGPVLHLPPADVTPSAPSIPSQGRTLQEVEREHILSPLRDTHGLIGGPKGAAARLGVKRTTLL